MLDSLANMGVAFAGEVQIGHGMKLEAWTNVSGTYQMSELCALQSNLPIDLFRAFRESVEPDLLERGLAQRLPPHFFLVKSIASAPDADEELNLQHFAEEGGADVAIEVATSAEAEMQ